MRPLQLLLQKKPLSSRFLKCLANRKFTCSSKFTNNENKEKLVSPLEGVKVIDLTRIVSGPYCTMLLGDLGAEIIKIEQPGLGDESRRWGPFIKGSDVSTYFVSINRNKKSVCVNLKSSAGKNIIKELAKKCDILVENFVPGKLENLGLGFETIKEIAPHLIYCSITGFGSKGPYKTKPAYDVIASSYGGLLHITGPRYGEPCKPGVALTDIATGLHAYGAIMSAMLQKVKTGVGQKVDCDLLSSQISCLINVGSNYLNANVEGERWGTSHGSIVPYETFRTSNGYLTIGTGSNDQFSHLCRVMSLNRLLDDKRFSNNTLRVRNREELIDILKSEFVKKSTTEWMNILDGSPFPFGPVNTISQVFSDRHVQHIGLVKEMEMDGGIKVKVVGPTVEFSNSDNSVRLPPPQLGQHTNRVLKEILNYTDLQIERLASNGDIQ